MIFFNSSMPRSGSTLLQNILGQNPNIHVTPTDGFLELIYAARLNFTNCVEFKAQDQQQMLRAWRGFCRGGLEGYAAGLSPKPHTCIKSRGIGANYAWFEAFMGEPPKIIVMARNIKAILSSMEKLHRANAERAKTVEDPSKMTGLTTEGRVREWLQGAAVGLALQRLQQMAHDGTIGGCLVVRYEDLTRNPHGAMNAVHEYLGLPAFRHDFDNVEQLTVENDAMYNMPSHLHKIASRVAWREPDYKDVLGAQLCEWIDQTCSGYQATYGYI